MTIPAAPRRGVGPLDVLFIGGYDSTNYVYVEVIRELEARGHRYTVLVENERDVINTKMFGAADIPVTPLAAYDLSGLARVTAAFSGQFIRRAQRGLFTEISQRGVFLVSFANLFSSVTMRVPVDLVITSAEAKFTDFEDNGLAYKMIAIGNPQYDSLIRARASWQAAHHGPVRKVLVVDQGAYPFGERGKKQLAETLTALARNNPDLTFHIKPRYLPNEVGEHLHSLSGHLFSHLVDPPHNLRLLSTSQGLEEIVTEYDAMITTWSTAHLDAAALGMPLLLIGGLDSVDVFDVRRQRVEAAYRHLADTGCLHDWRKLLSGPPPFATVSGDYLRQEFYDHSEPSAPRVVDLLEALQADVFSQGRVLSGKVRAGFSAFMGQRPSGWPAAELDAPSTKTDRLLFQRLNPVVQSLVFDHRCMGFALDMRRVLPLWERSVDPEAGEQGVDAVVTEAQWLGSQLKAEYFESHPEQVANDVFIQDHYFDWLLATRDYGGLHAYRGPVVARESLEFNRGMAYLRRGRVFRASRHIVESFSLSLQKDCRVLRKDKHITVMLQRVDSSLLPHAILFFLRHYRKDAALSVMEVPSRAGVEALVRHRMMALMRLGRAADARALYGEYAASVGDTRPMTRSGGVANAVLRVILAYDRAALHRLAEKLG